MKPRKLRTRNVQPWDNLTLKDGTLVTVLPFCEPEKRGWHYCVDCGETLRNNMECSAHETHDLIWRCSEHGLEARPVA